MLGECCDQLVGRTRRSDLLRPTAKDRDLVNVVLKSIVDPTRKSMMSGIARVANGAILLDIAQEHRQSVVGAARGTNDGFQK